MSSVFRLAALVVVLLSFNSTYAQDAVKRLKVASHKSPNYSNYVFENINDTTYFYLKSVKNRRTQISILEIILCHNP